jgi:hypothetical protein
MVSTDGEGGLAVMNGNENYFKAWPQAYIDTCTAAQNAGGIMFNGKKVNSAIIESDESFTPTLKNFKV